MVIPSYNKQTAIVWAFFRCDYGLGDRGFESRRGLETFLFTTASRSALGPTHPPIQWIPGDLSLGVKRSGREDVHSPPSSAEVRECVELYLHFPSTPSWYGAQLKHRDNFTLLYLNVKSTGTWHREFYSYRKIILCHHTDFSRQITFHQLIVIESYFDIPSRLVF
jgi:hypothetical protein